MKVEEKIGRMKGELNLVLRDKDGNVKLDRTIKNLILTDGLEVCAECLGGTGSQDYLQCIALGDSTQVPVTGDTDLIGSELGRVTSVNAYVASNKEQFVGTFGPGVGTGAIEEAILADANAASGARKSFSRVLTGTITKGAGDTLTVTWEVTIA